MTWEILETVMTLYMGGGALYTCIYILYVCLRAREIRIRMYIHIYAIRRTCMGARHDWR